MGGLLPVATKDVKGLQSNTNFIYSNQNQLLSGVRGLSVAKKFKLSSSGGSVTIMLSETREIDDQSSIVFLNVRRDAKGKYYACRYSLTPSSSSGFKAGGSIYYNGDYLYISHGHYSYGAFMILAMTPTCVYQGTEDISSNYTELTKIVDIADMISNTPIV